LQFSPDFPGCLRKIGVLTAVSAPRRSLLLARVINQEAGDAVEQVILAAGCRSNPARKFNHNEPLSSLTTLYSRLHRADDSHADLWSERRICPVFGYAARALCRD